MKKGLYFVFFLIFLLLTVRGELPAQENEKEDVKKTINELQMRLMELEGKLDAMEEQEKIHELDNRVDKMESELGWVKLEDPYSFRAYWNNRPIFETRNGDFRFELTGLILNDWTWQTANDPTEKAYEVGLGFTSAFEDSTEFRETRLGVQGRIYDRVVFKSEFNYTRGTSSFRDVYIGIDKVPYFGLVRVGHFWEPFGLEVMTSIKHITFMERGYTRDLSPDRNTGLSFRNAFLNRRMTFAAGVFRETDVFGDSCLDRANNRCLSGDGNYNWTARITGLPWYEDKGKKLLHLGLGFTRKSPHEKEVAYAARPRVNDTIFLVDTEPAGVTPREIAFGDDFENPLDDVDKVYNINPELALVYGPLSLQGEYVWNLNDVRGRQVFQRDPNTDQPILFKDREDADFNAWYAYVSYFLTGEHRPYNLNTAVFDNIKIRDNFYDRETGYGWGAWETAFRITGIDLEDEGVEGGELTTYNLGLNWYLNFNTRVMANYNYTDVERKIFYEVGPAQSPGFLKKFDDGRYHAFTMRFQVHW